MKTLLFDSSALISLSESCMASSLAFLKEKAQLKFIVPEMVYQECVERPSKTRQHGFSAFKIKKLFADLLIEESVAKKDLLKSVLDVANSLFIIEGNKLELIQAGEAECIALMLAGIGDAIVIDEKTLRLLVENPDKLKEVLKAEYGSKITIDEKMRLKWQQMTRGIKIIRSAELISVAAEKGYFDGFKTDKNSTFHSAISALRSYGCSLSNEEIKEFEQIMI